MDPCTCKHVYCKEITYKVQNTQIKCTCGEQSFYQEMTGQRHSAFLTYANIMGNNNIIFV